MQSTIAEYSTAKGTRTLHSGSKAQDKGIPVTPRFSESLHLVYHVPYTCYYTIYIYGIYIYHIYIYILQTSAYHIPDPFMQSFGPLGKAGGDSAAERQARGVGPLADSFNYSSIGLPSLLLVTI